MVEVGVCVSEMKLPGTGERLCVFTGTESSFAYSEPELLGGQRLNLFIILSSKHVFTNAAPDGAPVVSRCWRGREPSPSVFLTKPHPQSGSPVLRKSCIRVGRLSCPSRRQWRFCARDSAHPPSRASERPRLGEQRTKG